MFNLISKKRVKKAFNKVKKDVTSLRNNTNEWIITLNSSHRDMELRIAHLEDKIARIEKRTLKIKV